MAQKKAFIKGNKQKMLQSVRIGNMKEIKKMKDQNFEQEEEEQIKEQGVNLMSQKFVFENQL